MIDKIELRLPPWTDFCSTVATRLRQHGAARPGLHYTGVLDLRPHGFDAMLHYRKRRNEPTHKLELFDTAKKTHSELASLIEGVTEVNSSPLELMRIDLCVDIPGVRVSWFHANARFRYKRVERAIGQLKADVICKTEIETLTAGARPNVYRIYDKTAEQLARFRKACRKQSIDAEPLEFEKEFGHKQTDILTRIERQYGGGRLPDSMPTFGAIGQVAEIDPFESIELLSNQASAPTIEDWGLDEWLKGMHLRRELKERGAHNFSRWLNRYSRGNAARWNRRYAPFLSGSGENALAMADIVKLYRDSVTRQLAA